MVKFKTMSESRFKNSEKEKEDMEKRLKRTAKVMDPMERARREEERPLLAEQFQKQSRDKPPVSTRGSAESNRRCS